MVVGLISAIAALGGAIDAGRLYIVRSQLQAGVDAAALAGARAFGIDDDSANGRQAQALAYFDGNFQRDPNYMGTNNVVVRTNFAEVGGVNVTTVSADATLPLSFMRIFGFNQKTLTAVAKAELQPRPLEVMMVLDNTGSMRANLSGGRTRIQALKTAANDFIDILYQGSDTRRDLALGVVPYNITVNVGNLLLKERSNAVARVDGFNAGLINIWGSWPANPLAWKGCVMNDATVRDVSADRTYADPGAWDIGRTLPGEGGNPAVQPFFIPPIYVPRSSGSATSNAMKADPNGDYYRTEGNIPAVEGRFPWDGGEQKNNLYRLDQGLLGELGGNYLANTPLYRAFLWDYYIGLNNGSATSGDDVIRATGGGYLDPGTGSRTSAGWYVDWKRIPRYYDSNYWSAATSGVVNAQGGQVDSLWADRTPARTPNWQCPEEAMPLAYDRPKSAYADYIRDDNAAIYPGNGTIHHSGMLWGYRLLVRDDVFRRPRPARMTDEPARRALVFMTDGINEVDEDQNGWLSRTFTWYGRWMDQAISNTSPDAKTQMLRRFEKTCANLQREQNPPEVYIIALVANSNAVDAAFNNCAPGRVYRTSSTDDLRAAFRDVASELVDLHLVQ